MTSQQVRNLAFWSTNDHELTTTVTSARQQQLVVTGLEVGRQLEEILILTYCLAQRHLIIAQ